MFLLGALIALWALSAAYRLARGRLSPRDLGDAAVVITGCDSGFGHDTARALDAQGCRVIATCLTDKGADELRRACSKRLEVVALDLTKDSSVEAALARINKLCEDSGLWALINNAGLASGWNLDLSTLDDFRLVMEVNFFGMVRMTKGLLPLLKRSRGRVINVASIAGRVAPPAMMPYTCSKFAVEAFSQALRADMWRWGVRVAVVEPGFMRTALTLQAATVVQRAWERAPAEVRAEYGEEFFASSMERVAVVRDRALQDPALVVATLCDAVWSRVPKHKYLVGRDARVLAALAWLLPEWCTTWMLYAFNRPAVPAALKRARDGQ